MLCFPHRYILQVLATNIHESASIRLTGTATLTVYVTDDNDNAPVITSENVAEVNEEMMIGTQVIQVQASDLDHDLNSELRYAIISAGNNGFTIHDGNGMITTTKVLDREEQADYALGIQVCDKCIPKMCSNQSMTVIVTDINDNKPNFRSIFSSIIASKTQLFTVVAQVKAFDQDIGINAVLQFRLINTSTSLPFSIHSSSGEISVTSELPGESGVSYDLIVEAMDKGSPPQASAATFKIILSSDTDLSPIFPDRRFRIPIEENIGIDQTVAQCGVQISNSNRSNFSAASYTFVGSGDNTYENIFKVNGNNGDVIIVNPPDYETRISYSFQV